ncbi:MAG: hypothetical protein RL525_1020 [Bacteroidota bacterium]|jgi:hypothetical protein
MSQYNHAFCNHSITKVKYTSEFNFVAPYSDYETIILTISFPQPIKIIIYKLDFSQRPKRPTFDMESHHQNEAVI